MDNGAFSGAFCESRRMGGGGLPALSPRIFTNVHTDQGLAAIATAKRSRMLAAPSKQGVVNFVTFVTLAASAGSWTIDDFKRASATLA